MTTIITGWTGRGYDALGDRFYTSFGKHWPRGTGCFIFVDPDCQQRQGFDAYAGVANFKLSDCEGLAEFQKLHAGNPVAHGLVPNERWKDKERMAGYSFRWDASKFATQMFIPEAAAKHLPDGEIMVWFDADVVTTAAVPEGWIEGLIGDANLVYLGREPKHSEIGFWAVRLSPLTRNFLSGLSDLYCTGAVFELAETHSAFVFDHLRTSFVRISGLRSKSLTPDGRGHVWPSSPLGKYTVHSKGKRKWRGG